MAKHVQKSVEMQAIALLAASLKVVSDRTRKEVYEAFCETCRQNGLGEAGPQLWSLFANPVQASWEVVRPNA